VQPGDPTFSGALPRTTASTSAASAGRKRGRRNPEKIARDALHALAKQASGAKIVAMKGHMDILDD